MGRQRQSEEGTLALEAGIVGGEPHYLTCHERLLYKSFQLSVSVMVTGTLQGTKLATGVQLLV